MECTIFFNKSILGGIDSMKTVLIINTGGTIAMSEDRTTGKVSPSSQNPLMTYGSQFNRFANIEMIDFFHLPSPHMTLEHMLQLSHYIQTQQANYDGIIVTHGTDTLEETAYFLDLTVEIVIPVVVTGAMRSSNEIGSDGLSNLRSALFVALSNRTVKEGVVVVMNEEIHAAAFVTKTHTTNLATFQTPTFGPVGIVSKNNVLYFQSFVRDKVYPVSAIKKRVGLLKAYSGMEADVLNIYENYDGLVIEGLGAGNLPPATVEAVKRLILKGVKIVMVSRAFNGITEDVYDYVGGGKQLKQMGVIYTQGLSGVKARIKLITLLNSDQCTNIQESFASTID